MIPGEAGVEVVQKKRGVSKERGRSRSRTRSLSARSGGGGEFHQQGRFPTVAIKKEKVEEHEEKMTEKQNRRNGKGMQQTKLWKMREKTGKITKEVRIQRGRKASKERIILGATNVDGRSKIEDNRKGRRERDYKASAGDGDIRDVGKEVQKVD